VKRGQGARREPDVRGSRLIQYNVLLEAARTKSKRAPGQLSSGQVYLTSDICATQPNTSPRMHRPIGHISSTQGNEDFSTNLALFPIVDLIDLGCGGACWSVIELVYLADHVKAGDPFHTKSFLALLHEALGEYLDALRVSCVLPGECRYLMSGR
jgi:hypothetical protein